MYIHLGEETTVRGSEIIGIFDIENTSISKHTKEFFTKAEKNKWVEYVNFEMPKSFVVCESDGEDTVYISPISAATLRKRVRSVESGENERKRSFTGFAPQNAVVCATTEKLQ